MTATDWFLLACVIVCWACGTGLYYLLQSALSRERELCDEYAALSERYVALAREHAALMQREQVIAEACAENRERP